MEDTTIYELVRQAEQNDQQGNTLISKYVTFDMRENINKIEAYINSKHISGDTDSMGRDKPFFNIVTGIVNIWFRATDIDRKNIRIKSTKAEDTIMAFLVLSTLTSGCVRLTSVYSLMTGENSSTLWFSSYKVRRKRRRTLCRDYTVEQNYCRPY